MERLIVFVEHINANGQSGNVRPIARISNEDGLLILDDPTVAFPKRGLIFVSREFSLITEAISDGELFILNKFTYDENGEMDNCWAYGSDIEALPAKWFCPIIKISNAIDPSNPFVEENLSFLGSKYFFVQHEEFVYGPFLALQADDRWILRAPDTSPCSKLPTMHIWKASFKELYEKQLIFHSEYQQIVHETYITNIDLCSEIHTDIIDYIDDKRLINWANQNIFSKTERSFTKKELSGLRESVEKAKIIKEMLKTPRARRVLELIETHGDFEGERKTFLDGFFKSPKADELKEKYIESKKPELIAEYKEQLIADASKEIDSVIKERKKIEADIVGLKDYKQQLEKQVKESELQVEQNKKVFENKMLLEMKVRKDELNEIELSITDKRKLLEDLLIGENLKNEIESLEHNNRRLTIQNEKLEKTKEEFISQMVLQLEIQQRAKSPVKKVQEKHQQTPNAIDLNQCIQGSLSIEKIFDTYLNQWNRLGREMPKFELLHLLTAIHTNVLTLFSGEPGSGKTSLAKLLQHTLGLPQCNYKQISVGRGWVSDKDLLGYFNPINGEWVESESGLNRFFVNLSKNDKNQSPMSLIVLDEANLSPIEHYWSKFVGYCDDKTIPLDFNGYEVDFGLEESFRFIGTINTDHTTEKISPRVIDRAAVFELKSKGAKDVSFEDIISDEKFRWIPIKEIFNELNLQFEKYGEDEIVYFEEVFGEILNSLSETSSNSLPIVLSNRKINKIKRHFYLSKYICKEESPKDTLDTISMMYILPHINGYGSLYKKRLEAIKAKFSEKKCSKSESKLAEIITKGDVIGGFYSFI